MLRVNPSKDWKTYGDLDPYYGVLSAQKYRRQNMTAENKAEFFETGNAHAKAVLDVADNALGYKPRGRCLDFGCGVGRIALAFSPFFDMVVGVDVSPGMIKEAEQNAGAPNVVYRSSEDGAFMAPASYDFVHSYIVLQHIPSAEGYKIIERLLSALRTGGVGAIHFTYGGIDSGPRAVLKRIAKEISIIRYAANLAMRRKWNQPAMQMNHYNIPRVVELLSVAGVQSFVAYRVDDWGDLGLFIFFRKGDNGDVGPWSNPRC